MLRLSAWEDDGVEGNEEEEDAARGVVVFFFGSHLEGCTLCVASPEAARCKREKRSTREKELVVFSRGPERDRAQVHNNNNNST